MDKVSPDRRSRNMARIRSRDTAPEMVVRRYLHARGFRYRLHRKDLPGKPDVVFARRRLCIFVHGCFWHGCPRCIDGTRAVQSNQTYWRGKIAGNRARDERHRTALETAGWTILVIWECQAKNAETLAAALVEIPGLCATILPEARSVARP